MKQMQIYECIIYSSSSPPLKDLIYQRQTLAFAKISRTEEYNESARNADITRLL